jgi:RNA polymerase sigma factor (sigma-70 family)
MEVDDQHVERPAVELRDRGRDVVDAGARPDDEASRRVLLVRVREALGHLEPRDATLLGLHFVEEMTFQDIAATLGVTASRACQLLWRAVTRLRTQLGATVAEAA